MISIIQNHFLKLWLVGISGKERKKERSTQNAMVEYLWAMTDPPSPPPNSGFPGTASYLYLVASYDMC